MIGYAREELEFYPVPRAPAPRRTTAKNSRERSSDGEAHALGLYHAIT